MNRTLLSLTGLALCLMFSCLPGYARPLRLEDYLSLERVSDPQISPDGKRIVYVRSSVNVREDRFDNELWIMDANGGGNRQLMKEGGGARWSPDGTRIAFIESTEWGAEIFVRWMDAQGSTSQITRQGIKPEALKWSPDGRFIAFIAKVPATSQWSITLPQKPDGARWTQEATVIDRLHYRLDGMGQTDGSYAHLFVVSAEGGPPRQLTDGEWHAEPRKAGMTAYRGELEWTPDGRSILFSADRQADADTHFGRATLYAVDVADGHIRALTQTEGFWGISPGAKISPDGTQVAYVGTQSSTTSNYPSVELHLVGLDGRAERTLIADLPAGIDELAWDSNGKALYYSVQEQGAQRLYSVSLSGKVKPISSGGQSINFSSVSNTGIAVGTLSSAYESAQVVRYRLRDGQQLRPLTAVNEQLFKEVQLGRVEEMWYDSTDRTKVQGWIVYPPDFSPSKQYPLLLDLHGGPEQMAGASFSFPHQDMAAAGYVVVSPNPRGSAGYGGAFARAIYDAWPGRVDFEDLMAGVDSVVKRGFIDPQRLYVAGCSAGGTWTAWVVTQTDRFAGAVALCPIVNMISFAGSADIPGWVFNRYKKPYWEDPSAWLASSSIMQINKVKTPTLVMVGENDLRTPVAQSEELFTALKMMGVPTKLVLFQDERHSTTRKPSNMLRTQLYIRKWFGEWRRVMAADKPVWRNVGTP